MPRFICVGFICAAVSVAALAAFSGTAGAGPKKRPIDWSWCMDKNREFLDQQITSCTTLIGAAMQRPKKRSLGLFFNNRGVAYFRKGQYGLAVADFDEAINFGYATALYHRSLAKEKLDDKAGAAADFAAFKSQK